MTKKPEIQLASRGLEGEDLKALQALCEAEGWSLEARELEPNLVLVAVSDDFAPIEALSRRGQVVVAVLDKHKAGAVAPSLRAGAADCLERPLDPVKTRDAILRGAELGRLSKQVEASEQRLWQALPATRLIGDSPALASALSKAVQAAEYPVDVLILGETGSGKELLARVVHESSGRHNAPFVAVDCGAIQEDLADSVLFGHRRGAFTGAHEDHVGWVEQADGGTLFLDEIGNLSPGIQAKLLRALQNREIWRLGEAEPRPVEFRVLAATHADLQHEAEAGRFRLDLYHRLADIKITLPPLRERGDDVLLLAALFLGRHCSRYGKPTSRLSPEASACLSAFDWPGNVRQLENTMKQAAVMADEVVLLEHLSAELRQGPDPARAKAQARASSADPIDLPSGILPLWDLEQRVTQQVERQAIIDALAAAGQERDKAAGLLELHPKTLARKMRAYGL